MKVVVDSYAWLPKSELTPDQIVSLKQTLTVVPIKVGDFPGESPEPIPLYRDEGQLLGVPREFYFANRRPMVHETVLNVTRGALHDWLPVKFSGTLRAEQRSAVQEIATLFRGGIFGGIIQAKPGWGKTVAALALAAELGVPTLVVVHKEFLMDQWKERIKTFLPGAVIGHVQQDQCDFHGCTIVMGMVHSLAGAQYPAEFYEWPGLVITDEVHRIGASTWSVVPPRFRARWRLGFTATPRRKDGADDVFWKHIGPILFAGKEERLKPTVKRVWTNFKLVQTDRFNPNLAPRHLVLRFLCASKHRNDVIVDQVIQALAKGRKCLVLSERLEHLERIGDRLTSVWPQEYGEPPTIGHYVGGKTKAQLDVSAKARVILATIQYAAEGLDIPELDTLFLVTPMSDVEQAVGRILRPVDGKRSPIVVDFRDDSVPMLEAMGRKRDRYYRQVAA
jgi:superfamily II DNA or RNA helicase